MAQGKIARERMDILFRQAEEKFEQDRELSERYVEIARKIGERCQVPIPERYRRNFCSSCGSYWRIGENCRVRINSEKKVIEYICAECGERERYGY